MYENEEENKNNRIDIHPVFYPQNYKMNRCNCSYTNTLIQIHVQR